MIDPNDKWVWADDEDLSLRNLPSLDQKPEPIVDWLDLQPEAPPSADATKQQEPEPDESPAIMPADHSRRETPPSIVKATMLHLEGQPGQAIEVLQAGLRDGEPAAEVYAAMGALQMELEHFEDAAASYREALQREPDNESCQHNLALCAGKLNELSGPPKAHQALVRAIVLHMEGKIEEAIGELRRCLREGHENADIQAALGHLEFEAGRFDAAAQAYRKVLEREPLHRTCHYNLAVCLEKTGDYNGALSSFEKAFQIDSRRAEFGVGVGVCLLHLRRFADAALAFEACLKIQPDEEAALFGIAFALQSDGRLPEAEAAYAAVLERNPVHEEALHNLIGISGERAYAVNLLAIHPHSTAALQALFASDLAAGNSEAACSAGERLTAAEPDSFEAWFNFGIACHGAKRVEQAIAALSQAARIRPDSFEALSRLGAVLQEQGDLSGAKTVYESALKVSPDEPAVLWRLTAIAEQSGAIREAERLCAALASKAPKSEAVLFQLGLLRYQRADYTGSADAFRSCVQQRPEWPAAQFNLGLALWKCGNRDEARARLESLKGSYAPQSLYCLALMSAEHEDYQRALGYYRKLADSGEKTAELFYNSGLILQNLGRTEEAAQQYRDALGVKPDLDEAVQALAQVSKGPARVEEIRRNTRKESSAGPRLIKSR